MKIKNTLSGLVLTGALLAGGPALAQSDLLSGWSGSASINALFTDGNSDTRNIGGSINVTKQQGAWAHNAFGSVFNAENNDVRTADRFDLGYKLDRQITDRLYGFGRLRFDVDDFGNIDSRFSAFIGAGYEIFKDDKQSFSGELGIGGNTTDFISLTPQTITAPALDPVGIPLPLDPLTGLQQTTQVADPDVEPLESLSESSVALYGSLNYSNILSDILTFNSLFAFEADEDNTYIVWDNSLNVAVSERISVALGLLTRTNTDIVGPLGEETDTAFRVGIVYGI